MKKKEEKIPVKPPKVTLKKESSQARKFTPNKVQKTKGGGESLQKKTKNEKLKEKKVNKIVQFFEKISRDKRTDIATENYLGKMNYNLGLASVKLRSTDLTTIKTSVENHPIRLQKADYEPEDSTNGEPEGSHVTRD